MKDNSDISALGTNTQSPIADQNLADLPTTLTDTEPDPDLVMSETPQMEQPTAMEDFTDVSVSNDAKPLQEETPDHEHEAEMYIDGDRLQEDPTEADQEQGPDMDAVQEPSHFESNIGTQLPHTASPDEEDEDSLFVPEKSDALPTPSHQDLFSQHSDMPSPEAPKPKGNSASSFSILRAMQKRLQKSKSGAKKSHNAGNSLIRPSAEDDSYLDAYLNKGESTGGHTAAQDNDSDEEDRRAEQKFKKLKKHYDDIKQAKGKLSFRQDIEWAKIRQAEEMRRKKRARDIELLQEERHPKGNEPELLLESQSMDVNDEDDEFVAPRPSTRSSIQEPKISLREQEYRSMMVQLEADGENISKSKKRKSSEEDDSQSHAGPKTKKKVHKTRSKTKAPKKSKASGPATRTTARQKRENQRQIQSVASLFSSNVFKDQAGENAAQQPTFKSTKKADALKELIASVHPDNKKVANDDVKVLLAATKDFDGRGSVKADGHGLWLVKGMKTSLKPYQVLGAAFMRRRERSLDEPRGGLLADQMGLGKTLLSLANIVNGRAPKGENKTTLLVASPGLLSQWRKEIETHTDCGLTVMRYGTGNRLSSNCDEQILLKFDIVLTTWHEILRSYPKNEPPDEIQTAEEKIAWWKNEYETRRGILHKVAFYRIILDEAQAIKNHKSRTSIACRALMAKHRWALSGTPILNGLTELYPYFKFLNVPHTGSFKIFKHNYTDTNNPENAERLLLRLNQFMLRRTHADVLFGAPILKLPKANQMTHWCEFNAVERNIYEIVQHRFRLQINELSETGQLVKSYGNILVLLLRLRQLTSHVLMLQFVMRDLLELEDIARIRHVVTESHEDDSSGHTIIAIREQLDALSKEEIKKNKGSNVAGPPSTTQISQEDDESLEGLGTRMNTGKSFGKEYNFQPYLNSLTTGESFEKAKKEARCCSCGEGPDGLLLTSCHHLYCTPCYEKAQIKEAEKDAQFPYSPPCHVCSQNIIYALDCDPKADMEEYDFEDEGRLSPGAAKKQRDRARYKTEREDIKDDWLCLGGESMLPSAKTIAIKAQILNWLKENPSTKIIIYTQFLPMIRILAKVCVDEGWGAEQYHGKLSFSSREKAISRFADDPDTKILLASLRCGGLGLNLTMASRVIVIDPWWNSAAEQQAFCRVFRIGQTEPTFMTRFCVRNTVDDRLIQMQKRKQEEIDDIMDCDKSRIKKLGIRDLMRLFGPIADDADGKPFILVENADSRGGFHVDKDHEGYADEV